VRYVNRSLVAEALAKGSAALGLINAGFRRLNGTVTCFLFHRISADPKMGVTLPVFTDRRPYPPEFFCGVAG